MEELTIYLEDARRVRELEAQLAALERENARLAEELRVVSFRYRCETVVNLELQDLCRAHGVAYRPSLAARPWEAEASLIPDDPSGIKTAPIAAQRAEEPQEKSTGPPGGTAEGKATAAP